MRIQMRFIAYLFYLVCLSLCVPFGAAADVSVSFVGPGGNTAQTIPGNAGTFDVNLPLVKNTLNKITVTATDEFGNTAEKDVEITQLSFDSLVVAEVRAEPLPIERVEQLVADGVIDLQDPDNFNVSQFTIVLSIAQEPVEVSLPIAVPKAAEPTGFEVLQIPRGQSGGGRAPRIPDSEIIIFETEVPSPPGMSIPKLPGIIVIDGRIKTLKEFFDVDFLLMNTSGIFTLEEVSASLEFPDGGLSNTLPADGMASLGSIPPGNGLTPGQKEQEFIVRGDDKGNRRIRVNFGGKVAGPGIAEGEEVPFSGSAETTIEVKGPPEFLVEVTHPDAVQANVPYELTIDFTNVGDTPALFTTFDLDVGVDAEIVECGLDSAGDPECEALDGPSSRTLGHILPGENLRETYLIRPFKSGDISSCLGISDQNIDLKVNVGTIGCLVGKYPPNRVNPDGTPTVSMLPFNNAIGVGIDAPVVAIFSEEMSESTITTGENGTFNVFTKAGDLVPGILRFDVLNGDTFAVWQVFDGVTNRLAPNTSYTIQMTDEVQSLDGKRIVNEWVSVFTTTGEGINDTTLPEVSMVVLPPVNPNAIIPGQIAKLRVFPSDQGSGISRVQLRLKDLNVEGALPELIDEKKVSESNQPPFEFVVDSKNLVPGHIYEARATAFDGVFNSQDTTLALVIATDGPAPTIALTDDTNFEVRQGVPIDIAAVETTGGVIDVGYFLNGGAEPFETAPLPPYRIRFDTKPLSLGAHTITAVVQDGLGQVGQDTFNFTVIENTNPPVVAFTQPTSGANFLQNGEPILFTIDVTDDVAFDNADVEFFLDDPNGAPIFSGNIGFLIQPNGLSLGTHRMYARVTNAVGLFNDVNTTFAEFEVVDVLPGPPPPAPVISSISLATAGESTVTGTTSIAGGRVDISNTALAITQTVYANGSGAWNSEIAGNGGDGIQVIAFELSQTEQSPPANGVIPVPLVLQSISASPNPITFNSEGQTAMLTVTGTFNDASQDEVTDQASFVSSDTAVATVDASGVVLVQGPGSATIDIDVDGVQTSAAVNSNIISVVGIEVTPNSLALNTIGETVSLTVNELLSNSTSRAASQPTFATGDPTVVTVDSSGEVTVINAGTTNVSVGLANENVPPFLLPVTVTLAGDVPPTAQVINPPAGTTVERGAVVNVQVDAGDAVGGITNVELLVSGQTVFSDSQQVFPPESSVSRQFNFTVDPAAIIGGQISIVARATDTNGQQASSIPRVLTVVDETAPVVTITLPANGSVFNSGDIVDLVIDAGDGGGVRTIEFSASGSFAIGDSENFPPQSGDRQSIFQFVIPSGLTDPNLLIEAQATDASGNVGVAVPIAIEIGDADGEPPVTQVASASDPGSSTTTTVSYDVLAGVSDLDHVKLYFRRDGYGTFNLYTTLANPRGEFSPQSGSAGTIDFDSTRMGGDGTFEFYTIGVDLVGNVEPAPGTADTSQTIAAGTVFTEITTPTVISESDFSFDNQNLRITGVEVIIDGTHSFQNIELIGARIRHSDTDETTERKLTFDAWTITVDQFSSIDVNGRGYLGGFSGGNAACEGRTENNAVGAPTTVGGSHGGLGEVLGAGPASSVYGNLVSPMTSGGGGGCNGPSWPGADGGGVINLTAVNLVNDGTVSADGLSGPGNLAGSGAGGSVFLVLSSLSGTGDISANGGGFQVAGGGGRVAVHYVDLATYDTENIQAITGSSSGADGSDGTVFLRNVDETDGTLVIDGQGAVSDFAPLPIPPGFVFDNIIIQNSARVIIDGQVTVNNAFQVFDGSIVTHPVRAEEGLQIVAEDVFIDSTSSIDVTGKGYLGGFRDGSTVCEGETLNGLLGATSYSGGSHGGFGEFGTGEPGEVYGNPNNPTTLGAGGACNTEPWPGANGGGRVEIHAASVVEVDGAIIADGGQGPGNLAGSGAGGSVKIVTSLFKGSGAITANGGGFQTSGGGGRVFVEYALLGGVGENFAELRDIQAFSGFGSSGDAASGTVVLKRGTQSFGDLYIDAGRNGSSDPIFTAFPFIGRGLSAGLTGDTLTTDGVVPMLPNSLVGLEINPNSAQDTTFTIVSNTVNTITVDTSGGLLTDIAAAGDEYVGVTRYDNVTLRRGGFLSLAEQLFVVDTLLIDEFSTLTHYDATANFESGLEVQATTIDITSSSSIDVSARGYLGGFRPGVTDCFGRTLGNLPGAAEISGGSYGGLGEFFTGLPNPVYGDPTNPVELGSGGSCNTEPWFGGDGGGRVRIVTQALTVDGEIVADGQQGPGNLAGSGSGGSINITTGLLIGTGSIRANGGGFQTSGGGGRIAVRYQTLGMAVSQFQAVTGSGSGGDGGNGTIFLKQVGQTFGDFIVDGAGGSQVTDSTVYPAGLTFDNVLIQNGAAVIADTPIVATESFSILGGAVIRHSQGNEDGLSITAPTVIVDGSSSINASERGYLGGERPGSLHGCAGEILGRLPGADNIAGGSYGGYGKLHAANSTTNPAYGDPFNPTVLGSGGSCNTASWPGGNGGGRITIDASFTLDVDGAILANGQQGPGNLAGSGSGGSIKIFTGLLQGTGSINANGGGFQTSGGGGRVFVEYDALGSPGNDLNSLLNITALGGAGSGQDGGAGTVVLKDSAQAFGDLYVDAGKASTADNVTPLPLVGFEVNQGLTADTLTTSGNIDIIPNGLVGLTINPNENQTQTFTVLSNTANTITVDVSSGPLLTDVASVGDTYHGVYEFDNVFFRRGGFMILGDALRVLDTLFIDDDAELTHFDAAAGFESRLDIVTQTLQLSADSSIDVDGSGYVGGLAGGNTDCEGRTLGNVSGSTQYSGGSYGGLGEEVTGTANPTYGDANNPLELGSGGSCNGTFSGGDGGGHIRVKALETIVDGLITANGNNGSGNLAGSGSGGSVNIDTTSFSGAGTIRANGGGFQTAGGGGRVFVGFDGSSFTGTAEAITGSSSGADGEDGTVVLFPK